MTSPFFHLNLLSLSSGIVSPRSTFRLLTILYLFLSASFNGGTYSRWRIRDFEMVESIGSYHIALIDPPEEMFRWVKEAIPATYKLPYAPDPFRMPDEPLVALLGAVLPRVKNTSKKSPWPWSRKWTGDFRKYLREVEESIQNKKLFPELKSHNVLVMIKRACVSFLSFLYGSMF